MQPACKNIFPPVPLKLLGAGLIHLQQPEDEKETWLLSVKDKKSAYSTMRIPIEGKTDDKDKDDTEGHQAYNTWC